MEELQPVFFRHVKYMLYLIAIYVLGWGFTEYQTIFLGLIFGTLASLYNHWHLYRKTKQLELVVDHGKKIFGIGTLTRMSVAVLTMFFATQFSDFFHLTSVIIGIMTSYAVIIIDIFTMQFITSRKKRREVR